MKHKKIFAAVALPEKVKNELISKINNDPDLAFLDMKRVLKENLHITVKFFGFADEEEVFEVIALIKENLRGMPPFFVTLDKIVLAKDTKSPMLWAVGPKNEGLDIVNKVVSEATAPLNFKGKGKNRKYAFSLHVTLGRLKGCDEVGDTDIEKEINLRFPVKSVELMESFREKGRLSYASLSSFKLD